MAGLRNGSVNHAPTNESKSKSEGGSKRKFLCCGGSDEKDAKSLNDLKKEISITEHKLSLQELCSTLNTNIENGLSESQAADLLRKNGKNALTPPKETPEIIKFLKQMSNGFAILLWIGAIFCFIAFIIQFSGDPTTPYDNIWLGVALVLVVLITGCFQYYQESKSSKIMESFKKMIPQEAVVIRGGKEMTISAENLVIGDVVNVRIGDKIPADIRLVKVQGLKVDNSSLTGESEPQARAVDCSNDNPLETKNLAFFSTYAVEGNATGVVVRTGDYTAMGRIASLASGLNQNQTHLAAEIKHFVHIVTVVAFFFGITFFIIMLALG